MPSAAIKAEKRVKASLSLSQFKLFHQNADYIACYGQPAMSEDGWIINLPASDFFEGSYQTLPFETYLSATLLQEQSIVKQPLAKCISPEPCKEDWLAKIKSSGMTNYFHADCFRDVASMLINYNQHSLALCFIKTARELRPAGTLIRKIHDELAQSQDASFFNI